METKLLDKVFNFNLGRFNPEQTEAVTSFLPRLISGEPRQYAAERIIHRAVVYGCEPKDLAAVFAPVPKANSTCDRFLLTPCKRQNGRGNRSARAAGEGNLTVQKNRRIKNGAGVKAGEKKTRPFTKGDVLKCWLKVKDEAIDADGEKVLRKIYLSRNASQTTRQEPAADLRQEDEEARLPAHPPASTVGTPSRRRPAPVAADQHCRKRARASMPSPPVVQHQQDHFAAFARSPACLAAAFADAPAAAEADDDVDRFRHALEEFLSCCGALEKERTQPVLDEMLGGAAPELQAVWTIDQEPSIAAEEERYSWALLRRYRQRPIFRLDQLDGYKEFISYKLDGCISNVGIFDTKFIVDYTKLY
ncbi:hypothetical protein ACQ4PT_018539 [Festuca glaucescens]